MKFLDYYSKVDLIEQYRRASKRLILLDYDGTLITFFSNPSDAIPGDNLMEVLKKLNTSKNDLCIISGRNSDWFDKWFATLNIHIIAEHGGCVKLKGQPWLKKETGADNWKEGVRQVMNKYVQQCAATFIEEKEYAVVWHYRNANASEGSVLAEQLYQEFNNQLPGKELEVFSGKKIVEVKIKGINKGAAIKQFLTGSKYDFILAVGDDYTDEAMFRELAAVNNSFTIKVGDDASFAQYHLYTPQMVVSLLETFSYVIDR
ncbi:trehalose-phosphatase [Niastella yeongjuensis]|uniref:Trehalose 6-phosphate phosphatase n=1 Tax=Niastella yeongjuensis TaxID=354355 RepID=A0A1V9EQC0_9BACT|nr:trehalose-phosphatase [Niastella yeongjuensis]OQP48075.1 trehalose-phosphatase [Niastella yeongjuensis]SEO25775.1 trehalose 6-phosphatase [Niastella yeongjuensis]